MVVIALSGCDGSGKTTLALRLKEMLERCGVRVEYRREFDYFVLKYLLKLLGRRVDAERKRFLRKGYHLAAFDVLKYRLWTLLVWADSDIEALYLRLAKRKTFVILDRCIVDHVAAFEHLGYIGRNMRKFMLRYSVKPDLILVLDASPEVMYERKRGTHDYGIDFYREQRRRYLEIAEEIEAPVVDTSRSVDKSLDEVLVNTLLKLTRPEDIVLHVLSDPIDLSAPDPAKKPLDRIDWGSLDLRYMLVEASRNNVEFPFYSRLLQYRKDGAIVKALEIAEAKYTKFLNTLSEAVDALEGAGVDYIVFKTVAPFKSLPRDIDILVNERDKNKAIEALTSKGFKISKTHLVHKELSLSKNGVDIDLHWRIGWMSYRIVEESSILKNYTYRKLDSLLFRTPDATHELLLVMAHSILQHHYITLGELHYIRALIGLYDIDWGLIFEVIEQRGLREHFSHLISAIAAKEFFFYNRKNTNSMLQLHEKAAQYWMRSLDKTFLTSFIDVLKPVVWLKGPSVTSYGSMVLGVVDAVLTMYRKARYAVFRELPYNKPLKEILNLVKM